MALRRAVAVDLCGVTQHFDSGFDRPRIPLADAGLQVEEHLLAPRGIELAEFFGCQRRLPRDRLPEGLVTRLLGNLEVRGKRDAFRDRDDRLGLAFSDARYLVGDRVESEADALEVNRFGFDPAGPENRLWHN